MKVRTPASHQLDLAPYAGRWIAVVRDHVAGVGRTAHEAAASAKTTRPKEEPLVLFVPENFNADKVTG
jgi:hypothetical protein